MEQEPESIVVEVAALAAIRVAAGGCSSCFPLFDLFLQSIHEVDTHLPTQVDHVRGHSDAQRHPSPASSENGGEIGCAAEIVGNRPELHAGVLPAVRPTRA